MALEAAEQLSLILSSVKLLTKVSTQDNPDNGCCCLIPRLKFNLKAYRDLPNSLSRKITTTTSCSELGDLSASNTFPVYLDFTDNCVFLLSLLDETLNHLFKKDKEDSAKECPPSSSPKALLSVSELKCVYGLLQFVVSLGIYPFLSPEIDKLLRLKLSTAKSLEKFDQLSIKVRSLLLYRSVRTLTNVLSNPVLGSLVSSKHLADILAALIQICFSPSSCECRALTSQSDVGPNTFYNDEDQNGISKFQFEWCTEALCKIVQQSYQPLVIKELCALQSFLLPKARNSSAIRSNWVRRACGKLLSERLMDKNGVQNVLKAIFDTGDDDWKKCQAVANLIATCPAQALSINQYYSLICPQVLNLLVSHSKNQFFKVCVLTLSVMLTKQADLARKYLVEPLLESFTSCSKSECSLISAIDVLHKVTCALEPSSPLFADLLSYCPLFFRIWLAGTGSKESVQCKEILYQVLRISSTSDVLGFLCFMCGFQPCSAENRQKLFEQHYSTNIVLEYSSEDSSKLKIKTLSDAAILEMMNAEEMEKVGSGLLVLLNEGLKEIKIVGRFFLTCLQYLSSIILPKRKHLTSPGATPKTISCSDQRSGDPDISQVANSTLLDCESILPPSQTEAYFSSLVLFVTASICENISSALLQEVNLFDLLVSIKSLIECHALYCKDHDNKDCLKVTSNEGSDILGGSITLSIVFGLLSAVLNGAMEVNKKHRLFLAELWPLLEIISNDYPNKELCSTAYELNICIATLGAVWSSDVKHKANEQVYKAKIMLTESMSSLHGMKKNVNSTECSNASDETCEVTTDEADSTQLPSPYLMATKDVNDPLIPVKGHGIIALTKLIDNRDQETLMHSNDLLSLFVECLCNLDSYIYLAAINGLVSLSTVPSVCESVICSLCQSYAQFSTPSVASTGKLYTGQLTVSSIALGTKEGSTSFVGHGANLPKASNSEKLDIDARMKIGEALLKVSQLCGDFLPYYLDLFSAAIFSNTKDPEPLIRASSLSNLADLCANVQLSFYRIQVELFGCVSCILRTEQDVKVLQAALLVLKLTLKNLSKDSVESLSEELLEVYRMLKNIESSNIDELTCTHAQAALGELDMLMRDYLFPTTSKQLTKKISMLSTT